MLRSTSSARRAAGSTAVTEEGNGGGGWWKWLLGLLVALLRNPELLRLLVAAQE